MPSDPYALASRRQRAHRRRVDGVLPGAAAHALPLVVTALALPFTSPIFFRFVDDSPASFDSGLTGVVFRAAVLLLALTTFDVHSATVRDPDRPLLSILPVDAARVVRAQLVEVVRQRLWLLPAFAIFFSPLSAAGHPIAHAVALGALAAVWALGLVASAVAYLLAVDAARSERWHGLLDAIRGYNPREQAALIYAPGVVLFVTAFFMVRAAGAVAPVSRGLLFPGLLWLALPLLLAGEGLRRVAPLARGSWFHVTELVADIDARYASLVDEAEDRSVYLDWMVRWLPPGVRVWALKDLRHGWRARRGWISAMWGGGIVAALAAWSGQSPQQGLLVGLLAVWGCGAVGVLMERDEPEFLSAWLPRGGAERRLARGLVLIAWLQGAVWLPGAAVAVHDGLGAGLAFVSLLQVAAVLVALTSTGLTVLRRHALLAYIPVAALASIAALVVGVPS